MLKSKKSRSWFSCSFFLRCRLAGDSEQLFISSRTRRCHQSGCPAWNNCSGRATKRTWVMCSPNLLAFFRN